MRIDPLLWKKNIEYAVSELLKAVNQRLTFEENMWMKQITVVSHVTPNTAFTVTHSLGKVPTTWIAMPQASSTIYEHDRANWTTSTMQLKCSGSSVTIVLTVL